MLIPAPEVDAARSAERRVCSVTNVQLTGARELNQYPVTQRRHAEFSETQPAFNNAAGWAETLAEAAVGSRVLGGPGVTVKPCRRLKRGFALIATGQLNFPGAP